LDEGSSRRTIRILSGEIDLPSLTRFVVLSVVAIIVGALIPGPTLTRIGIFYMIATVSVVGVTMSRTPIDVALRQRGASTTGLLVAAWAALASATLLAARLIGRDFDLALAWPGLPNAALAVRSLSDVGLVAGFFFACTYGLGRVRQRNKGLRAGSLAGLALLIAWAAWSMKMPSKQYLGLWAEQLSSHTRFLALFDISNALWLGAILPFWAIKEIAPDSIQRFLRGSLLDAGGIRPVLLLLFLPLLGGLLVSVALTGSSGHIELLSLRWYIIKLGVFLLWTAVYEELVFRVICLSLFEQAFARPNTNEIRSALAAIASSLLFALAHYRAGWFTMTAAGVSGLIYCFVILRTKNLEACILAHAIWDTLLVRWS